MSIPSQFRSTAFRWEYSGSESGEGLLKQLSCLLHDILIYSIHSSTTTDI